MLFFTFTMGGRLCRPKMLQNIDIFGLFAKKYIFLLEFFNANQKNIFNFFK